MGAVLTMTGKLDEISEAIGGLRSKFDALDKNIIANRHIADERHQENTTRLGEIEKTLAALAADRRIAIVGISIATGAFMWVLSHIAPALLERLGWK
jgi:hypothetical protein